MSRSAWYNDWSKGLSPSDLVRHAQRTLLPDKERRSDYTKNNLRGVASLICRVGLRPNSKTFAPQAVAAFMAVLAHVNYEQDSYFSVQLRFGSGAALGALKLWDRTHTVAQFRLPQLQQMILNEVVDVSEIGNVVARIVLLLAMDESVSDLLYYGNFIAVHKFLNVVGAEEMPVLTRRMHASTGNTKDACHTWLSKWDGWQMGS